MSDIISLLRNCPALKPHSNQGEIEYGLSLEHAAADHIETLEARMAKLEGALQSIIGVDERAWSLRGATKGLTKAAEIARAALEEK